MSVVVELPLTDDFEVDDFGWIVSNNLELVFVVTVVELVPGVLDAGLDSAAGVV